MKYYLIYVIGQLCFYVYVKLFLHERILDSEINISGFSIIRCDGMSRAGGGVCVYVSNSTTYDIWGNIQFLQCVSPVIIVYIIISPLNSYLYIHWILDFNLNKYYYYYMFDILKLCL